MFNLSRVQYNDHINIHLGIRPFRCKKCNKCYNNRGAYHNHMRIHGNERLYICPLCKSDFLWEASLKWHLNVHKNKGEITAQMARQMYEGTMNVVRLKKKQLKITAQQKKENHTSHPIKKTTITVKKIQLIVNYREEMQSKTAMIMKTQKMTNTGWMKRMQSILIQRNVFLNWQMDRLIPSIFYTFFII
ncbi:Zinc finger protein [Trichinella pseudospiralis]|uniref:Zinc finger protein n=1 Tax=Trichinella pseudospiralis TaxID=6337 RepID=A0A0V0Y7T5_TRIPS|nr:Zinc finger protein [Trichinella pseudospiralis]